MEPDAVAPQKPYGAQFELTVTVSATSFFVVHVVATVTAYWVIVAPPSRVIN